MSVLRFFSLLWGSILGLVIIVAVTLGAIIISAMLGIADKYNLPIWIFWIGMVVAIWWVWHTAGRYLWYSVVNMLGKGQEVAKKITANRSDKLALSFKTSRNRYINIGNPFRGLFVMGGAGSGKSESVAVPAIQQFIYQGFAGLVYDFKFPTLGNDVNSFLAAEDNGIKHYWLDFEHPENSYRVNPLNPNYLSNSSYAIEFSQAIIDNLINSESGKADFWNTSAISLLSACIWFLRKNHPHICDLPHVFALVCSNDNDLLELLHTDTETANMTISVYNAMRRKADAQVAGVISTLQNAIARINTPQLMYILGGDDFSLDLNNSEHPTILTLGNSPTLTKTFAPLCALITTVCIKLMNRQGKNPSFFLLDEAPTLKIPNFAMLPATGRSNKIATIYMCQDYSQLENQYGKAGAAEIFANLNNHFYGRVSSGATAAMLSKQFGRIDDVYTTESQSNMDILRTNYSESMREVDMMRSNVFTSLEVGEFAGLAVESDTPIFRAKLSQAKRQAPQPCTRNAAAVNYSGYFERVRADIDSLLALPNSNSQTPKEEHKTEQIGVKDNGKEIDPFLFQ